VARFLRILPSALALFAILAYVILACLRLGYPYELEWQEGGMLQMVQRVTSGAGMYTEPDLTYSAFPYPPLFFWLAAAATKVFGEGFLALRLVSFVSSLACLGLLFQLGRERAGTRAGLLCAGLFAATWRFAGAWLDVGRVDSLFLALTLLAFLVLLRSTGARATALAAVLFFLAFLAKQSALGIAAPLVVPLYAKRGPRAALLFTVVLAALVAGSTWIGDAQSDGWYSWYVFELLSGHAFEEAAIGGYWVDLVRNLGIALVVGVLGTIAAPKDERAPFDLAFAIGLILIAWLSRAHVGGYDNTFLPACVAISLYAGVALSHAFHGGGRWVPVAAAALVAQFVLLGYDPRAQVPSAAAEAAGDEIVERLRAIDGPVFIPYHGYLGERAGKGGSIHAMAVIDLLQGEDAETARTFMRSLRAALGNRDFACLVLDDRSWSDDMPEIMRGYRFGALAAPEVLDAFAPVTGAVHSPAYFYLRR